MEVGKRVHGFHYRTAKNSKGFYSDLVVVDRLTKSTHFVLGKSTYTASKWALLYMSEIKSLQTAMGTRLDFSTAFHPQTDGQTERLNQVLEDMLRACALEFLGSWDSHLHLMEFAYNNSFQATIGMAPFEALYGKCCRSPVCWGEVDEQRLMGPELVQSTNEAIQKIRSRMHTAQSRRGKLSPRFVGPFEILERIGPVAYRLALPPSLSTVHDVFHVSMLRKYVPDPSHVVDYEPLEIDENLSYIEQPVEVLAREVKMLRNREIPLVKVLWQNHKVEEATWKREDDMSLLFPSLPNDRPSSPPAFRQHRHPLLSIPAFLFRRHRPQATISLCRQLWSNARESAVSAAVGQPSTPPPSSPSSQNRRASSPLVVRYVEAKLHRSPSSRRHLSLLPSTLDHGISELTLKFSGFTVGLIDDSSPLLGHRCPDVLCIVVVLVGYVVSWNCMSVDLKVLMLGKGIVRGRPMRGKKDA
ncbi:pol protein [Cucumis melo var. makuwa]|uniref:Pol protein n=1 Tax=Cucumis melo var. makuwa TaxID=1194695 RepID=A0A5A7VLA0_CUCMM|nr:pol protein [Cucumis melo var. makuwa]